MRALLAAFVVASVLATSAAASITTSYSGTASWGQPFAISFTTDSVGPVSVNASWVPKKGARYVLTVKHLVDPADTYSYDQICQVYEPLNGSGSGQTVGDYTCQFANGNPGFWTAEFRPLSGKVSVVLQVTD